jgi:hypothetical protein
MSASIPPIGFSSSTITEVTVGAEPARPLRPRAVVNQTDRVWTLPGLCWNVRVTTSFGALPVQVLRKHDPLRLSDGSIRRIQWIDKIQLDEGFLAAYPDAQPVMIRAGSLGQGIPSQDILVSPCQKLAVQTTNYTFELRMARDLLGRPGFLRQPQSMLTYYMFHCGQPSRVSVEGASFYTAA